VGGARHWQKGLNAKKGGGKKKGGKADDHRRAMTSGVTGLKGQRREKSEGEKISPDLSRERGGKAK